MNVSAYEIMNNVIDAKKLDKEDLLGKLDVFLLAGRITKDEYQELIKKIQQVYD